MWLLDQVLLFSLTGKISVRPYKVTVEANTTLEVFLLSFAAWIRLIIGTNESIKFNLGS